MADVITGNTQLATTKNELIISLVQKELKFAAKLLPFTTDYSAFAGKGVKQVSVPKLSSFSVQNRASAVAGDIQALATTKDIINLDINAYVSWLIDASDEIETSIDAQIQFAMRAAAAHGRYVDEQITQKIFTHGVDLGNAPITNDLVLDLREQLLESHCEMENLVAVAGVDQEKALLKLEQFSKNDVFGGPNAPIYSGQIGRLYGVPLVVTSNPLFAGRVAMWDKAALGVAFQLQPNLAEQPEIAYGTRAMRVAMDQKWGVEALQKGELGQASTITPLIAYINTP